MTDVVFIVRLIVINLLKILIILRLAFYSMVPPVRVRVHVLIAGSLLLPYHHPAVLLLQMRSDALLIDRFWVIRQLIAIGIPASQLMFFFFLHLFIFTQALEVRIVLVDRCR